MPQRKSCCRFLQGSPAFLLVAKSEDLEKGSATQHRPKQLLQSASRLVWPAITRTPDGWVGRKVCPRVCESVKRNCVVRQQEFRSEEHTSELQSLMRISYAVFCLKNKKQRQ